MDESSPLSPWRQGARSNSAELSVRPPEGEPHTLAAVIDTNELVLAPPPQSGTKARTERRQRSLKTVELGKRGGKPAERTNPEAERARLRRHTG